MIQPIGHFRVWRELYTKPIWLKSTLEQKVILMTLMAMANFKANQWEWQGEKFELEAGQFITSANSIIENTGGNVTRQNVRTALARFEKLEFLTTKTTKTGTLVTIANWEDYQYTDGYTNQYNNQRVTKSQPTPNQDLTTIEERKKDKKDKEGKNSIKESVFDSYNFGDALKKTLNDFIDMRKQIKAPMTDNAINLMVTKLKRLSSDEAEQIAILEQSIMNSYKGIFPINKQNLNNNSENKEVDLTPKGNDFSKWG